MARNQGINQAKQNKKDEFYTRLEDIENELKHYKKQLEGKTVFCNCDDPYESNFFKYFAMNFNNFKLKKLITTCYDSSTIAGTQLSLFDDNLDLNNNKNKKAYKVEITKIDDLNNDGAFNLDDIEVLLKRKNIVKKLIGDGDFRSDECVELLKEADVVVTNPPFSLFIQFINLLINNNKKFIIIGNQNEMVTKDVFELIKNNKIWVGYNYNKTYQFIVPEHYDSTQRDKNGKKVVNVPAINWFTNIDIDRRHSEFIFYKSYIGHESEYPKYYNFDGIDVDSVSKIPDDYYGYMGVPCTFFNDYNPDEFEIIDKASQIKKTMIHTTWGNKEEIHFIDAKTNEIIYRMPYTVTERKKGNGIRLNDSNKPGASPFGRIIIKRKNKNGNKIK